MLCFVTGLFVPRADTEAHGQTLNSLPLASGPAFQTDSFYSKVRQLVMRYYPEATFEKRGNRMRFSSEILPFVQSAAAAKDPWGLTDRAAAEGIDCNITIIAGKAPSVPPSAANTSGTALSSPYSPTLNAHVAVRIQSGDNAPNRFVQELSTLVSDFDSSVSF